MNEEQSVDQSTAGDGSLPSPSDHADHDNKVDKDQSSGCKQGATDEPSDKQSTNDGGTLSSPFDGVEHDNKAGKDQLPCGGSDATDELNIGQSTGGEDFLQSQSAVVDNHGNYPKLLFWS